MTTNSQSTPELIFTPTKPPDPTLKLTPAQLQKILVLWLLFTSGNSVKDIKAAWPTNIAPHIKDLAQPDDFLASAVRNESAFQSISGSYSAFVNPIWGGSGVCPQPSIDLITQLFPE